MILGVVDLTPSNIARSEDEDPRYVAARAADYLRELNQRPWGALPLTPWRRFSRRVIRVGQWFARKGRELIQEHWDIAVFDVIFGSLKAFLIYPALYFAGLTWTIPFMEYVPLNTQLWTAGYLYCRRHILSVIGKFRYGVSLNRLNAFRDEALRIHPRDVRNIHRFEHASAVWTLRVRQSGLVDWVTRVRRQPREPNVVLQSELRKAITDDEFVFQSNYLRNNAYLYEEIVIQKILESETDRASLLERLVAETPVEPGPPHDLTEAIAESLIPAYARVIEQGNCLTETLKENLGHKFSATSLSLRWINWSYQRRTYRKLAELERLEYRLLADVVRGTAIDSSEYRSLISRKREEINVWMDRAWRYGERAKAGKTKREAHQVIRNEIPRAQSHGLRVRLARFAYRISPSARATGPPPPPFRA